MVTHRFILCVLHNCILFVVVEVSLACVFIFRSIRRHTHLAACALSRAVGFSNVHSYFVCIVGWSCIRLCGLIYKCRWLPGRKERTNYCLWWLSTFWCFVWVTAAWTPRSGVDWSLNSCLLESQLLLAVAVVHFWCEDRRASNVLISANTS